jgi:hypothetical protein
MWNTATRALSLQPVPESTTVSCVMYPLPALVFGIELVMECEVPCVWCTTTCPCLVSWDGSWRVLSWSWSVWEHMWYPVSSALVLFGVLECMRYSVCVWCCTVCPCVWYPVLSIETVWCPVQCVLLEWCMTISKLEVYYPLFCGGR